jgi:hypothetical protein
MSTTTRRGARLADDGNAMVKISEITVEMLREHRGDLIESILEQAQEAGADPDGCDAAPVVQGDAAAQQLAQAWKGSAAIRQRFKAAGFAGFLRWAHTERRSGRDLAASVSALGGSLPAVKP